MTRALSRIYKACPEREKLQKNFFIRLFIEKLKYKVNERKKYSTNQRIIIGDVVIENEEDKMKN